jgi:hypothetical protein
MDAANQQTRQHRHPATGFSDIFGGDKSHQISIPPMDETIPAVSFPSRDHAQSSRSMSESSPTREQQLPAQDSREMKIKKKEAGPFFLTLVI